MMLAEAVSRRALNGARTAVRPTTEAFQALSVSLLYSSRAAGFSRRALHQHQHRRQAELSSSLRQRHSDALSNVAAAQIGKQSALSAFAPQARKLHASAVVRHGGKGRPAAGEGIKLIFKKSDGTFLKEVEANEGDDIVDVSWEWDLDIEAACEKSIACSTCHVILEPDQYDRLLDKEDISDDENDMLDLAFGLTDTSRLGCQIKVDKEMDGTTITLPSATRNLRVDGSKPTHH